MFSYCTLYAQTIANVSRDCDTESDVPQQIYVVHLKESSNKNCYSHDDGLKSNLF